MIQILSGLHSSEKDHTSMTGGTLKVDKTVSSDQAITLYQYSIYLSPTKRLQDMDEFHKGLHTSEHLLAYSRDTGSVRASIAELIPGFDGKCILDISPYQFEDKSHGFRLISLEKFSIELLQKSVKTSIQRALEYLEGIQKGTKGDKDCYLDVPFAKAEQCGQYSFHSVIEARNSLKDITNDIPVSEEILETADHSMISCDLRLLKPQLDGVEDMLMLSPGFSYMISQRIESGLKKKFPNSIMYIGTFGCMTGMYLVASLQNKENKVEVKNIHKEVMNVLGGIDRDDLLLYEQKQLDGILSNYEQYGEK